jgi:hypothetical protein
VSPPQVARGRPATADDPAPQTASGPVQDHPTKISLPPIDDTTAVQLCRRREAALRMPQLDHLGRSDPWGLVTDCQREPLRAFWRVLREKGLLTDEIHAEFVRIAKREAA